MEREGLIVTARTPATERDRAFWQERVRRYERELQEVNAGRGRRERADVHADLTRALVKLRQASQ